MIYTVQFSEPLFWDSPEAGVSFKNVTTGELTSNVTNAGVSGETNIIQFDVSWVNEPSPFHEIAFLYDENAGDFRGKRAAMKSVVLTLQRGLSIKALVAYLTRSGWTIDETDKGFRVRQGHITVTCDMLKRCDLSSIKAPPIRDAIRAGLKAQGLCERG